MEDKKGQMLILNYHRVGFPKSNSRYKGIYVAPKHLEYHVKILRNAGYQFATVSDGLKLHAEGAKVCCLTFDDGYEDNQTLGWPILRQLGVPATIYVITGDVGKRQHSWSEAGSGEVADLLTWDALGQLASEGCEIGSHAHWHVHFSRYSKAYQMEALLRSREEIKKEVGFDVATFAYPYGDYSEETVECVRAAGFKAAVTTKAGLNTSLADPFRMLRLPMKGHLPHHYLKAYMRLRPYTHAG